MTSYATDSLTYASGSTAQARVMLANYVSATSILLSASTDYWYEGKTSNYTWGSIPDNSTELQDASQATEEYVEKLWAWADQDADGFLNKDELVRVAWITQVRSESMKYRGHIWLCVISGAVDRTMLGG